MNTASVLSRRSVMALGAAALAGSFGRSAAAQRKRTVLVELFTSQGCSSCPPADEFLQELRSLKGVLAITYHVDYWDYLGWRDTLAAPEFSQRQYDYAKARNDMAVYTPQMIVDGRKHYVGSNRSTVNEAIKQASKEPPGVTMALHGTDTEMRLEIGRHADAPEAVVWLLPIVPQVSVKILKGEIAGREISYHNIVRRLIPAGMWKGEAKTLTLPRDGVLDPDCKGCVALLQQGKAGPILGLASWGQVSG